MRRKAGIIAVAVLAFGLVLGFADDDTPSTDVSTANPAQPTARVEPIRQGDPCPRFGATAVNEKGQAFDCEPVGYDYALRWINP